MKAVLPLLPVLFFAACVQPPEYPIEPVIEYLNISKTSMVQGSGEEDFLFVTISFTDGDGDLGFFQEGSNQVETDLFVRDLRFEDVTEKFTIPFIPELGSNNGISGEISFRLFTTCCIFPDWVTDASFPCDPSTQYPADTIQYEVYIRDRAGNESNRVLTDQVVVFCL